MPVNVRVDAPFKSEAFRSNPHAESMKKEMAGIPEIKPRMGSPNQKPVCQVCAHPCQIAGAGKYPGCPKKSCERGVC